MFDYITFMCKQFVIILRRDNQISPMPVCPVDQIITCSKRIKSFILARGFKSREIKHHIHVAHFLDVSISGDRSVRFVRKDRIAGIAFPCFHILGECDTYPFSL